ncbi:MAG TPA: hypothetical protein VFH63_08875 [candidate division Zixibacteria bacterium]|nr:hypothetical protein [candidate division Zixibacteria bacterium]
MDDRDFERRLRDDLRDWTDASGPRLPASWPEAARIVIAEGGRARPSRPMIAGLAAAAVVAAVAVGMTLADLRITEPPASPIASGPSGSPAGLASPSVQPGPSQLDLSRIAWWDRLSIGFGAIPEWTPPPNPPVQPDGYEQIRIGTLDGRVTAMLTLSREPGHSNVSGPVNGKVVVVDDRPLFSSIRVVDAFTGSSEYVHFHLERITAAALSPSGEVLYYVTVHPTTGQDRGIWALPLNGNPERLIARAPDFDPGEAPRWHLHVSPDGATLAAQFCHGEVACTTRVIDLGSGRVRDSEEIGPIHRIVGREAFAERIGTTDWVAFDLDTRAVRIAPDRAMGEGANLDFGAELPGDWEARWPQITGDSLPHGEEPRPVLLWNVRTRAELRTPPLAVQWPPGGCEPPAPHEMPSGRPVGSTIRVLQGETASLIAGTGEDLVQTYAGPLPAPQLVDVAGEVTVRGRTAALGRVDPPGVPPNWAPVIIDMIDPSYPVYQWEEGGCWFRVELQGLGLGVLEPRQRPSAEEYATRF